MNNKAKSLFVPLLLLYPLVALVLGVLNLLRYGLALDILAATIASLSIILFLVVSFIVDLPRTDRYLLLPSAFIFVPSLFSFTNILFGTLSLFNVMGVLTAIIWAVYLFWYSTFDERLTNTILREGQILPEFSLLDLEGKKVTSKSFLGKPSIYLFYRGNWCPLCMAQVKELASFYKQLEKRGVSTILISPQPQEHSLLLAEKHKVAFEYMVDGGNKVAKQLGINQDNGLPFGLQFLGYDKDTVLPTVVITDPSGKILFADLTDNYRLRPEPQIFLNILDKYRSKPIIQLM